MKKVFLLLIILISIISCGKKREIISQGEMNFNEKKVQYELYYQNDTCYKVISDNSLLLAILSAPTESHIKDSTFSETDFFPNGYVFQKKSFLHGKPDGEWTIWYSTTKKKSVSKTQNGYLVEYRSWYENGKPQVNGLRNQNGRMTRREFFQNGGTSQAFDTDSLGNGTCISYFKNGKKQTEGNLFKFAPVGLWKRYDSLGNHLSDSLYGFDPKLTGK